MDKIGLARRQEKPEAVLDKAAGQEFSSVIWEKLSGHSTSPWTNCNLGKVNKNGKNTETAIGHTVRTKIFHISLSGFGNYVLFSLIRKK